MPDLRRAGEDIVDRPLFDPPPVAQPVPTTTARATATTAKKATATAPAAAKQVAGVANLLNVSATTTAPSAQVQPGGNITMLTGADISSFDPATFVNNSVDGFPAAAVFDMLVYV